MRSTKKIIIGTVVVTVIILIALQFIAKSKLDDYLHNELPVFVELSYDNLSLNILLGSVSIDRAKISLYNSDGIVYGHLQAKKLAVNNFSLWDYVFNKKYSVKEVIATDPNFNYYPFHKDTVNDKPTNEQGVHPVITIDHFRIENGSYQQYKNEKDSVRYSLDKLRLSLTNIASKTAQKENSQLPFDFDLTELSAQNIFVDLNKYESLRVRTLSTDDEMVKLDSLRLVPKYSETALSKILKRERDHISMLVPEIAIYDLNHKSVIRDNLLDCDSVRIKQADLVVYRDKRVSDDERYKKLYGKMLRELSFKINISKVNIDNSYISYAEKVNTQNRAGRIFFSDVSAGIENLSNLKENTAETKIKAKALFMGKAAMELDWKFEINNSNDTFIATGYFKDFNASIANTFFMNNLHVKVAGQVSEIYYTFSGDAVASTGDLKMKYDDFKLAILDKDGKEKKKFLSSIGNLFVKNSSDSEPDKFKEGKIKVERNTTKSFFNYLWINLEDGLKDVLL